MGMILQPQLGGPLTATDYLEFLDGRPDDERWQLIDGVAIMMAPPSLVHQRVSYNLCRLLNDAFDELRPEFGALQEVGLTVPRIDNFRPHADVAVIDADIRDTSFADRFYLAAEVLSDSNTHTLIAAKRRNYQRHRDNLYVLVIDRLSFRIEVFARRNGWLVEVLDRPEARLDLPELSFGCRVADLYKGTPLARRNV